MADSGDMRRFRFALAKVARWREQLEQEARRLLAAELSELAALERELEQAEATLLACRTEEDSAAAGLAEAVATTTRRRQAVLIEQRTMRAHRVELARTQYHERRREVETLRRLRDRRHEEWRGECLAAEQAELDELARLGRAVPNAAGELP